jgi:dihydrofolate synthase / folylpolyglutamate synthase
MSRSRMDSIESRLSSLAHSRGVNLSLDRIQSVLNKLGNPEVHLKFIHIAGTNGKGTTADYIAQLLEIEGYRVGLYTSPHLESYVERFIINGVNIELEVLGRYVSDIERDLEGHGLTEFELLTILALLYFRDEAVDYVVWETGLGGRLDATNVVAPILTIITSIAMDHEAFLGNSLEEIALEKAGILKKGIPLVLLGNKVLVEKVILNEARKKNVAVTKVSREGDNYLDINKRVAVTAIQELGFQKCRIDDQWVSEMTTRLGGRLEVIRKEPLLLLDGSHNLQGVNKCLDYLIENQYDNVHFIYGATMRNDLSQIVTRLKTLGRQVTFCEFDHDRAVTRKGYEELMGDDETCEVIDKCNLSKYMGSIRSMTSDVCVLGSLYFIGMLRSVIISKD